MATTFGLGIALGAHVLAFEWIEGQTLAACLKARGGKPVSLRGAAQVIHSVCEALEAAEEHGEGAPHGALRPDAVWIGQNGVVKVAEFGVASALVGQLGIGVLPVDEQTCLAPEVKAGGAATLQSDVFSVGAITYQLLTGRSTAQGYVAPSKAHEHGTPAIDSWLLKCLAPDPANRYAIFDVVRESLDDLVQHAPEPAPTADFGVALRAAGAAGRVSLVAPDPNAPGAGRPQVGARVSIDEGFRPTADVQAAGAAPSAIVDLGSLLAQVTENDSQRWIVVKDGLDHGPFSGRELVRMLVAGEVSSTHGVMNMDTGERKPVAQWPEFSEFAAQYAAKVKQEATAVAVTKVESSEKKAGRTKLLVGGALILAVVGGGVAFAVTRTASDSERVAQADLDGLYEMGEIAIEGTAETLTDPHAAGGGSRRHGGGGGQRPTGGGGTPGAPSEGGRGRGLRPVLRRRHEPRSGDGRHQRRRGRRWPAHVRPGGRRHEPARQPRLRRVRGPRAGARRRPQRRHHRHRHPGQRPGAGRQRPRGQPGVQVVRQPRGARGQLPLVRRAAHGRPLPLQRALTGAGACLRPPQV
ncbi:MAG: protein kinase [Sandaracinaceae bacterium]|nr:protein kinase [Sandaracinaceae bacterium]